METVVGVAPTQQRAWRVMVFSAAGLLLLGWLLNTPAGLLGKADAVGYAVCHRIDARSFHLGGRPIPLCARCTGMYLGAVLGLLYQFASGRKRSELPPLRVLAILGALAVAFFVDGLNSYLHFFPKVPTLYEPHNTLRLLTGTGMGLVIAAALFPAFNQTVWKDPSPQPALSSLRHLSGLLALDWNVRQYPSNKTFRAQIHALALAFTMVPVAETDSFTIRP